MGKAITDSTKLKEVLNALNYSAHQLSVELEYKSPATVYHVINEINSLSSGMINRIVDRIPQVNKRYLESGELPILLTGYDFEQQKRQLNKFSDSDIEFLKKVKALIDLPERVDFIEKQLLEIKNMLDDKA